MSLDEMGLKPTYNTATRLLEVFAVLVRSENTPTVHEISRQLGISTKTAERYLAAINQAIENSVRVRGLAGCERLDFARPFSWSAYAAKMPRSKERKSKRRFTDFPVVPGIQGGGW